MAIYQTLPMGSFFEEKVPFDLISIKNEGWSGSFWLTIIWNKRTKFDERTEARVGSNPPPRQPPFAYFWNIICFCTKKRNAFRCTYLRCSFRFETIQNPQAKSFLVFWREKDFHFQFTERSEPCDVFPPQQKRPLWLGQWFLSTQQI